GSDERERGQAARVAHRRLRGDPAAKRTPDEMDAGEVELVEKIEIEVRQIADGIEPCRRVGGAETRVLGSDDIELFRQPRHAREPDSHPAAAMEKEQWRPRPAAHEAGGSRGSRWSRLNDRPFVPGLSLPADRRRGVIIIPLEYQGHIH